MQPLIKCLSDTVGSQVAQVVKNFLEEEIQDSRYRIYKIVSAFSASSAATQITLDTDHHLLCCL